MTGSQELRSNAEWADALWAFWTARADSGSVVSLHIDENDLPSVRQAGNAAALANAVLPLIQPHARPMFGPLLREHEDWRVKGCVGPNPALPTLALLVLAATRMAREGEISPHNYYRRLAELLSGTDGDVEDWRTNLSAKSDELVPIWEHTSLWLRDLGFVSTIAKHTHLTRIGYALSQALLRRSDRYALSHLWHLLDLQAGQEVSGPEILKAARIWLHRPRGLNLYLHQRLLMQPPDTLVEALLVDAAHDWDGQVYTPEGRSAQIAWLEAWRDGGASTIVWAGSAGASLTANVENFTHGATFEVQGTLWKIEPRQIATLRYDQFEDRWKEGPIGLGAPHWLVWEPELSTVVRQFIVDVLGEGIATNVRPKLVNGLRVAEIPPFIDAGRLAEGIKRFQLATDSLTTEELRAGGTARASFKARLANGLELRTLFAKQTYIMGGAPDLYYPTSGEGSTITITLDGVKQAFPRSGVALPLRELDWLESGSHACSVEDQILTFQLVEEGDVPKMPTKSLGKRPRVWDGVLDDDGPLRGAYVASASLAATPKVSVVHALRRAKETYMLGPSGECRLIRVPANSDVWAAATPSNVFSFSRSRTEGWLIQVFDNQVVATQVAAVPPGETPEGGVDWTLWHSVRQMLDRCILPEALELVLRAGDVHAQ